MRSGSGGIPRDRPNYLGEGFEAPIPVNGTSKRKVEWVRIDSGLRFAAESAMCPACDVLDLSTKFERDRDGAYVLVCSRGHSWRAFPRDD